MISGFFLLLRLAIAWYLVALLVYGFSVMLWNPLGIAVTILGTLVVAFTLMHGFTHIRRVRLLGHKPSSETLGNRHRRQIELPFGADDAFALLDTIMREFASGAAVTCDRGGWRLHANIDLPGHRETPAWRNPLCCFVSLRNQVSATLAPGHDSSSVVIICEPWCAAWSDWLRVDDGANLETAEAISQALTRGVAARRHAEREAAAQSAIEKALALARLRLLQAQVEPHFLYNTLASAQILARNDPPRAEAMLGHLIDYLRRSLPDAGQALSTLGDELERARAYLAIMQIRMGNRLTMKIDAASELRAVPLPPMMLQTLVENAIKHGLEPKPAGGCVWIFARRENTRVAITVADDGCGFDATASGTGIGIGLRNVRERLRLLYAADASLTVDANFPTGVAATLSVPVNVAQEVSGD